MSKQVLMSFHLFHSLVRKLTAFEILPFTLTQIASSNQMVGNIFQDDIRYLTTRWERVVDNE